MLARTADAAAVVLRRRHEHPNGPMCGRFTQRLSGRALRALYAPAPGASALNLEPRTNGAPTQTFAACRLDDAGTRSIAKLRWGRVPFWAPDIKMGAHFIAHPDRAPLSFAGLWDRWSRNGAPIETFTILTTTGAHALANLHHRQPASIAQADFGAWLAPDTPVEQLLALARAQAVDGPFEYWPISQAVNNARNNDPRLLERRAGAPATC